MPSRARIGSDLVQTINADTSAPANTINISANGLVSVNSSIVPAANVTYDLGTSALSWRDLYLSGNTIVLGNTTITSANGVLKINNEQIVVIANSAAQPPSPAFQGTTSGYTAGGNINPFATCNVIDKFPFSADGNATDVGDLTVARGGGAGIASSTDGYAAGGNSYTPANPYWGQKNIVDKTPFSSDANSTDVGDLQGTKFGGVGGASSSTDGYAFGGCGYPTPSPPGGGNLLQIDKFPFSGAFAITDVGDLNANPNNYTGQVAGLSSTTHGYRAGGCYSGIGTSQLEKFSFSVDGNATDVGDLTDAIFGAGGTSASNAGFVSGGRQFNSPVCQNKIQCTPFASDTGTTCVGALIQGQHYNTATQSGETSGYHSAGMWPAGQPAAGNIIQKFSYASGGDSTDVGDLSVARGNRVGEGAAGFQS